MANFNQSAGLWTPSLKQRQRGETDGEVGRGRKTNGMGGGEGVRAKDLNKHKESGPPSPHCQQRRHFVLECLSLPFIRVAALLSVNERIAHLALSRLCRLFCGYHVDHGAVLLGLAWLGLAWLRPIEEVPVPSTPGLDEKAGRRGKRDREKGSGESTSRSRCLGTSLGKAMVNA